MSHDGTAGVVGDVVLLKFDTIINIFGINIAISISIKTGFGLQFFQMGTTFKNTRHSWPLIYL